MRSILYASFLFSIVLSALSGGALAQCWSCGLSAMGNSMANTAQQMMLQNMREQQQEEQLKLQHEQEMQRMQAQHDLEMQRMQAIQQQQQQQQELARQQTELQEREAEQKTRELADQGDASAQYQIGVEYYQGQGMPQDYGQAMQWFRKSADQGNAIGQLNLAGMYQNGQGVRQDNLQAYRWYSIAADRFSTSEAQARDMAINNRDKVATMLTMKQIVKAQKLAMNWKPTLQRPPSWSPQKQQANTNPVPASKLVGPRTAAAVDPKQIEITFWQTIQNSTDVADFQDYLQQYPKGSFASLARRRVASLQK